MPQTLTIIDQNGQESGTKEVSDEVLGVTASPAVIRQALNQNRANQRQGTSAAKNRARVKGSGEKPWRQKGTGRARAGTRQSPIWRGGGVVFGPHPRSHNQRLNKKMKRQALLAVLSDILREGRLSVIEELEIAEPKTRRMLELLSGLDLEGRILVLIDAGSKDEKGEYPPAIRNIFLAARNLPYVTVLSCANLNIYDLLNHDNLIMTKSALEKLEETYG